MEVILHGGWPSAMPKELIRALLFYSLFGDRKMKFKSTSLPLAIILLTALMSGCASITGTTNQSISVQTKEQAGKEGPGAACELSNSKGKWFVTSPGSVTVTRSNDDMQVLCNKQGSEPGRASVVSATKGAMFGNILFGGGIGAIIDHDSGAAYEYPSFIQVLMGTFTKIDPPQTSAEQPAGGDPNAQPAAMQPATALVAPASTPALTSPTSQEDKLRELKRLSDAGLISEAVFLERQRKILE
ncbi:MAG: SHOCT domain-containing protein [bacterium]